MTMPTLFVSHGAPTLALQPGNTGNVLVELAQALPRPKAILMISAHWTAREPTASVADKPETIYDFYGFPEELYRLKYSVPGAPGLARRTKQLLNAAGFATGVAPDRGLDHGAWVPLRIMYPNADIPVTQLSVQPAQGAAYHYRLGQSLKLLREEGVLVIGSGNFTHNLYELDRFSSAAPTAPYVVEFSEWMAARMRDGDIDALLSYRQRAPHAARAHPTEEHLLPLYAALGAADGERGMVRLDPGATFGNPNHPLVQRLKHEQTSLADWAQLLLDQAMLAEGAPLEDPAAFVKRMNQMLLEHAVS